MSMSKTETKELGTVTTACDVSFAVGNLDYGMVTVPVGTKVSRRVIMDRDAPWKPITTKVSDWFVEHYEIDKLICEFKGGELFRMDMKNYGISMPNANVRKIDGEGVWVYDEPIKEHRSRHY
jgi:hypothetical protein